MTCLAIYHYNIGEMYDLSKVDKLRHYFLNFILGGSTKTSNAAVLDILSCFFGICV